MTRRFAGPRGVVWLGPASYQGAARRGTVRVGYVFHGDWLGRVARGDAARGGTGRVSSW